MDFNDVIVAASSPMAEGGLRAVIRLSGAGAQAIAQHVVELPETARGVYLRRDLHFLATHNALATVLVFMAPASFTGEDVVELHIPNSPALVHETIAQLIAAGSAAGRQVRSAEPGEFSARAFFNGKIDLSEAEGIAATINAANESQLRAAASLREGDLHRWTEATAEALADLLARVEAGIDFADEEDVRFIDTPALAGGLAKLEHDIHEQLRHAARVERLDSLPTVVFVGRPNVGKSSLINALAGVERSIVSPIAGTTRDMLSVEMHSGNRAVRLVDAPGEEEMTSELVGKMMAAREAALLEADLIVHVSDSAEMAAADAYPAEHLLVRNKADLMNPQEEKTSNAIAVSAKTGSNLDTLRTLLIDKAHATESTSTRRLALNQRHRTLLQETTGTLRRGVDIAAASGPGELIAAEMRHALDSLGQITGTISPDEIIGRIFSRFCIGK